MDSQAARREAHSLPPLSRDADATVITSSPGMITLDARVLFSSAAIFFAMLVVSAIVLIGYLTHPPTPVAHAASKPVTQAQGPLVNYGTAVPTPAINLPNGPPIQLPE